MAPSPTFHSLSENSSLEPEAGC